MIRAALLATVAVGALAACGAKNTGVAVTTDFQAARFVPEVPQPAPATLPPKKRRVGGLHGEAAVAYAVRNAKRSPTSGEMQGGVWVVDDADSYTSYDLYLRRGMTAYVGLPTGEEFRGGIAGRTDLYFVSLDYCGNRPCFSISPKGNKVTGNLQLMTSGGPYSFNIVHAATPLQGVELNRARPVSSAGSYLQGGAPQPRGDFTRLKFVTDCGDNEALPPWLHGSSAYADSDKLVIQFAGPVSQLPALRAGQEGEQAPNYRAARSNGLLWLVTDRRITEGALVIGDECARFTVDEAANTGNAPTPQQWQAAAPEMARRFDFLPEAE
jgi:hypothetical protein